MDLQTRRPYQRSTELAVRHAPPFSCRITPSELVHGWTSTIPALRHILPPEILELLLYHEYLREVAKTCNEIHRSYDKWLKDYQEKMEQQHNSKLQPYTWHKDDIVFWKMPKSGNHGLSFEPRAAGPFRIHDLPTKHRALLYTLDGKPKVNVATDQLIYFPYTKSDIDDWLEIKEEINNNDKENIKKENRMTRLNNMEAKLAHPLPEQTTILIDMGR